MALETYSQALELIYAKKWSEATSLLEQVIAETENAQLADRARQNLDTCRRQTAEETDVDPYLRAVYEKNCGHLETALELCLAERKEREEERYAYLLASLHSLSGATEQALEYLETAIRLDPRNRVHAYHDPDFADIRGQEEFAHLISGKSES